MAAKHFMATLQNGIKIAYIDQRPEDEPKGVVVLIHGFPQTSYQFRKVIPLVSAAGYRVIAPDYRGAGHSSKPQGGHEHFTKSILAADIQFLLCHLQIYGKIHMVGHDIGGMVAYAFAARYPDQTASVIWGECPLPGTKAMEADRTIHNVQQFHFLFHSVPDLPEALVSGKEEIYITHFYNKLGYNAAAFTDEDISHYAKQYQQPGAMRCAFNTYRAFQKDGEENLDWIKKHGKCKVRSMAMSGSESRHRDAAWDMMAEVHEDDTYDAVVVADSNHWIAEENPKGFATAVVDFISA